MKDYLYERLEFGKSCWNWKRAINDSGYGVFKFEGKFHYAHRASFFLHGGVLLENEVVDHVCKNRRCCNPKHLRALDRIVNCRQGAPKEKFRCGICETKKLRGSDGRLRCRPCQNKHSREHKRRKSSYS